MNRHRLYRCNHDRRIAGVAAGVAEYFDLDPTLVRVLWFVSFFFGGFTLLLYIVMAIVIPLEPDAYAPAGPWQPGSDAWGQPASGPAAAAGFGGGAPGGSSEQAGAEAAGTSGTSDTSAYAPTGAYGPTNAYGPTAPAAARADWHATYAHRRRDASWAGPFFGVALIVIGGVALANELLPNFDTNWVWPGLIVALGVLLVARSATSRADNK